MEYYATLRMHGQLYTTYTNLTNITLSEGSQTQNCAYVWYASISKVQKSAELVYVVRSQDNGYLCGGDWEVT